MFLASIRPLLSSNAKELSRVDQMGDNFAGVMTQKIEAMWAQKLGLNHYDSTLVDELLQLMTLSSVDYTIFFRKLSYIPDNISGLKESFYLPNSEEVDAQWSRWLKRWSDCIKSCGDLRGKSIEMKRINPKYTWREWLIVSAYKTAEQGDYSLIRELQAVFSNPYDEQTSEFESRYDRLRPKEFFDIGGVSHYSCSS